MSEDDVSDNVNVRYAVDARAGKPATPVEELPEIPDIITELR